jgi:hypothetical protein
LRGLYQQAEQLPATGERKVYSTQTIYNYRSAVKNRALNRDTFEQEVTELCKIR